MSIFAKNITAMKTKKNIKLLTVLFIIATIFSSLNIRYTSIKGENENGKRDESISFSIMPHFPLGFSMPGDSIIDLSSNKEYVPGISDNYTFHVDRNQPSAGKTKAQELIQKMDKEVISARVDPNSSKAYKSGYIFGYRLTIIHVILLYLCGIILTIIPFLYFLRMVLTILKGDIFVKKNERSLLYIGLYFLALFIIYLILKIEFWAKAIPLMSEEGYRITLSSFNFDALAMAIFFFILSKVFTLGREMKEDQEYMV